MIYLSYSISVVANSQPQWDESFLILETPVVHHRQGGSCETLHLFVFLLVTVGNLTGEMFGRQDDLFRENYRYCSENHICNGLRGHLQRH